MRRRRRAYLVTLSIAAAAAAVLLVTGSYQDPFVTAIRVVVVVACLGAAALLWTRVVPLRLVERGLAIVVLASLAAIIVRWRLDPAPDDHTLAWLALGFALSVLVYGRRLGLRANLLLYGLLVAAVVTLPWVSGPVPAGQLVNHLAVHAAIIAVLHALGGRYEALLAARDLAASHEAEANTDPLTGVANRRRLGAELSAAVDRARATQQPLSVVSFDLDRFKAINDRFGHDAGDAVLREVVARARSVTRSQDLLGRWGGEEFLLLLADCDERTAAEVAEACRASLAEEPFDDVGSVTASFGVAALAPGEGRDDLLRRVDRRLYAAKLGGRDRVVAAGDPAARPGRPRPGPTEG